jgi:hypothetical protein
MPADGGLMAWRAGESDGEETAGGGRGAEDGLGHGAGEACSEAWPARRKIERLPPRHVPSARSAAGVRPGSRSEVDVPAREPTDAAGNFPFLEERGQADRGRGLVTSSVSDETYRTNPSRRSP